MNKGNTPNQLVMKITMKLLLMLLVVAGTVTLTSCKKLLPEQVTVFGYVTNEDGQPFENVRVSLLSNPSPTGWLNSTDWFTDENGYYELVFEPESSTESHYLYFVVNKDDYWYRYDCYVSIWKAKQEINVVLKKWD